MTEENFFNRAINKICKDYDYNFANEFKLLFQKKEKEINNLQTRWDSLREWIKENSWYYNTSDGCQWVDQFKLLDKMNELEGGDNDSNV